MFSCLPPTHKIGRTRFGCHSNEQIRLDGLDVITRHADEYSVPAYFFLFAARLVENCRRLLRRVRYKLIVLYQLVVGPGGHWLAGMCRGKNTKLKVFHSI